MKKTIKFNFKELRVGDEIYDCTTREWRKVLGKDINGFTTGGSDTDTPNINTKKTTHNYNKDGVHSMGTFQSAVATKRTLVADDIEEDSNGKWVVVLYPKHKSIIVRDSFATKCTGIHTMSKAYVTAHLDSYIPYGTKRYTKENAELLCEILNYK